MTVCTAQVPVPITRLPAKCPPGPLALLVGVYQLIDKIPLDVKGKRQAWER